MTDIYASDTATGGQSEAKWKFTGWHMLGLMGVFFAKVFIANGIFLYFAITTFSGIETSDAYRKGLDYNARLAEARKIDAQNWTMKMRVENGTLLVSIRDGEGRPLSGLSLTGRAGRPATAKFDTSFGLKETESGLYEADQALPGVGRWVVAVEQNSVSGSETATGQAVGTVERTQLEAAGQQQVAFRAKERVWVRP